MLVPTSLAGKWVEILFELVDWAVAQLWWLNQLIAMSYDQTSKV